MSTVQSEDKSNEPEINDLEDTKPRRVSPPPAAEPAAELAALPAAQPPEIDPLPLQAAEPPAELAAPIEDTREPADSSEHTRPVEVGLDPAEDASLAQTGVSFTHPDAAPAFDETIPPPPGLETPSAPRPVQRPAGTLPAGVRPPGKPGSGKPVRKKAPGAGDPNRPGGPGAATRPRPKGKRRFPWFLFPILGLLILLVVAGISAAGGYASGIGLRKEAESTQVAQAVMDHFQLGLQAMGENNFYRARQHFEYVLQLDPTFPGAADKLAETLLYLNATATPTSVPTPTVTPTPDTRAVDDLYNQAKQAIQNSDWDAAINSLLALRGKDVNAHTVDVDGMLFIALRNRGRTKITKADLEGGIYDLTLAANFAPLDTEAQGLLDWSQLYITGASFWEIDWAQVVQYFSQVAPQMPNLTDSSGMSANERYRQALFEYGNQLAAQGQACKALELYQQSLAIGQNATVQAAFDNASKGCGGGETAPNETPKPNKKKTPTPGP